MKKEKALISSVSVIMDKNNEDVLYQVEYFSGKIRNYWIMRDLVPERVKTFLYTGLLTHRQTMKTGILSVYRYGNQ